MPDFSKPTRPDEALDYVASLLKARENSYRQLAADNLVRADVLAQARLELVESPASSYRKYQPAPPQDSVE